MSFLPQYRHDRKGDEESLPLFSADQENDEDTLPAYPPRLVGESSGSTTHNVTYTFVPRWPIKGSEQDALGVLGETKEETVAIVQRGFPNLSEYPPHRIEFLSPVENDRWGKILDEAWPGFKHNPPSRLRVQVADLPGDEERRDARVRRKNLRQNICFGSLIFSPIILIFMFIILASLGVFE